jgi:hypothetical protein
MNRDRRSSSNDPTDEPVATQSSHTASGLSGGRPGPGVELNADYTEDAVNRAGVDTSTPRRYEQPLDDDSDPVMPSDDATLNTKI